MRFKVTWTVSGTSTVWVEDTDRALAGVTDAHSDEEAFFLLDEYYNYDLRNELVSNFDEREAPHIGIVWEVF